MGGLVTTARGKSSSDDRFSSRVPRLHQRMRESIIPGPLPAQPRAARRAAPAAEVRRLYKTGELSVTGWEDRVDHVIDTSDELDVPPSLPQRAFAQLRPRIRAPCQTHICGT